ncbi:hypothetical protein L207DRAFT_591505 [Hyaloscypha variabilis F]|uniref:Uncharacterized protein n=1 Tax=Hyaloscypha variabilis (strain UAMH 11265 / GT02V1 / F) TaxID=1149755 RepID=A0A2J6QZ48_HYAVF|nr:hypothetical protein L207DRAFT_591505 [Hyaloscypha variabilis F]
MAHTTRIFLALIASSTVLGAATNLTTNWNPNGDGCVDTKGFLSCYDTQASTGVNCLDNCANDNQEGSTAYKTCVSGCTGHWLASNVGCWLETCWNQVYSCEYQLTTMSYFDGATPGGLVQNADIPFFPPPDGASAGACSCNLGYVYGNITASVVPADSGTSSGCVSSDGSITSLFTCECCALSWPISNILNTCPSSDLSVIGFPGYVTSIQNYLASDSDKCAVLNNGTATCVKDYGFPFVGTTAYNPLSLPAGEPGTEPLSNTAGNAFTVFPSPTMTLTLYPAYTSIITAAPFEKSAGADANEVQGSSIVDAGGAVVTATGVVATGTATGTGTAAATATKANSGARMGDNTVLLSISVFSFKSSRAQLGGLTPQILAAFPVYCGSKFSGWVTLNLPGKNPSELEEVPILCNASLRTLVLIWRRKGA